VGRVKIVRAPYARVVFSNVRTLKEMVFKVEDLKAL